MVKSNYEFLTGDIIGLLEGMIESSIFLRRQDCDEVLEIFLKLTPFVATIWDRHLNMRTVCRRLRYDLPLLPLPPDYKPEQYAGYEKDLDDYVENFLVERKYDGIYGHVFNLGTVNKPEMHLVLSKGPLRRDYLGAWIQAWSDDEEARGGAPPDPSSLAGHLEAGNLPVGPGSSKNGESAQEIDTYLFRKRLADLTKNPAERVRAALPPPPPAPSDSHPTPEAVADLDDGTVSTLSGLSSETEGIENLPHEVAEVQPEKAEVQPEEADVQPEEADVQPDEANVQPDEANVQPDEADVVGPGVDPGDQA